MQPPENNKKCCRFAQTIFELKTTMTCHVTIYDPIHHLKIHNLLLLTISQSYSPLYEMNQYLDHPLTYFYEVEMGPGLNSPEIVT